MSRINIKVLCHQVRSEVVVGTAFSDVMIDRGWGSWVMVVGRETGTSPTGMGGGTVESVDGDRSMGNNDFRLGRSTFVQLVEPSGETGR